MTELFDVSCAVVGLVAGTASVADLCVTEHRALMISRTQLMLVLSGAVFLVACLYVGYANEVLKNLVPPWHRVTLLIGFMLGAGAVSRWIMAFDLQRNLKRIRRARAKRGNGR